MESTGISERTGMAPPRPRLERVTGWLAASKLDALVVTGPALVNWLTGYSRYYGGPSAAVITPAGERTLVVVRDETGPAEQLSSADHIVGYGERGFGLELGLVRLLVDAVLRVGAVSSASRIGVAGDFGADLAAGPGAGADWVRADAELHQMTLVKDADEIDRIFHSYELCWLAHAALAEGAAAGASEIEMMSAAQAAAQVGHGSPVEFGADVLAGANTAEVCAPVVIAGRTRPGPGEPVIADLSVGAGGYWADTCRTYLNGANAEIEEARGQLVPILAATAAELRTGNTGAAVFGGMRAADRGRLAGRRVPAPRRPRSRAERLRRPACDPGGPPGRGELDGDGARAWCLPAGPVRGAAGEPVPGHAGRRHRAGRGGRAAAGPAGAVGVAQLAARAAIDPAGHHMIWPPVKFTAWPVM